MERIKIILLILTILFCFAVVGYLEDPADYHLEPVQEQIAWEHGYVKIPDGAGGYHYGPIKED